MRLSKPSIIREIRENRLSFDPPIRSEQITPSSIDLRLGNKFITFNRKIEEQAQIGVEIGIDAGSVDWQAFVARYGETSEVPDGGRFTVPPRELVLGWTKERISLPDTLAGRVEGKSRLARIGLLVHVTAPTLQVGWQGDLQLEFYNLGPAPLILRPDILICQIILEQVTDRYVHDGVFQHQSSD
ncbi:MAG: dCTP deaminase [Dehalococcoidia bacterium]|nr:dCTP deaminase [Dehalococcoidia bacterium]